MDGTYVYNDNASIKTYVDNYKSYLEILGIEIKSARLIKKEELIELGCNSTVNGSYGNCLEAPKWIYATSYWTGSAYDYSNVWFVNANDSGDMSKGWCGFENYRGVRPVIVIPASSI